MPIVLNRIDDRLIHGQVLLGWCAPLGITRIVLVDPEVARNTWEQDLYRMAVPEGIELIFEDVPEATEHLAGWQADRLRTLVLTGRIDVMARLHAGAGHIMHAINLGGVHSGPGREEVLRYVYLSADERAVLTELAGQGAAISAQDVPGSQPVDLEDLW